MADGGQQRTRRFSAFVSYSTDDVAFARRLHKRLETYRLPRKLRPVSPGGPTPRQLKPLFRDVDELIAAYDLSAAVQDALAQSDFLIVVCSPNAVESEWVGREIDYFRKLHGDSHILAVLIDGTPATAFHPALLGAQGGPRLEPLAADFRPDSPSRRLAMLKLVAALAGVELDDLIHRDAQRQTRRTLGWSGLAAAVVLVVGVLTTLTFTARAETELKRAQATGLVDHMLTDVRKTLQRTGRLDQLAAVNESAMAYYRGQDLAKLTDDELRQRAKLLQAMGEDDEKRGNLAKARAAFVEAHRTTGKLLATKPNDTARIYAHAQSEYWVGFINWRNGDGAAARRGFEAYALLAKRLVALDPNKAEWLSESGYATSNIGMLALRQRGDLLAARRSFQESLLQLRKASEITPSDRRLRLDVADAYGWLADVERLNSQFESAWHHRHKVTEILSQLRIAEPDNDEFQSVTLANELALARLEADRHDIKSSHDRIKRNIVISKELLSKDPKNMEYRRRVTSLILFDTYLRQRHDPDRKAISERYDNTYMTCNQKYYNFKEEELLLCEIVKHGNDRYNSVSTLSLYLKAKISLLLSNNKYSPMWSLDYEQELSSL